MFFTSRLWLGLVWVLLIVATVAAQETVDLDRGFRVPPEAAKPWAYWWWIHGNVDRASITRDLEEMKEKGFSGVLLFDARGYHDVYVPPPPARNEFMSPEWRALVKHALAEANRLGIEVSINLSSCAGALKGPWPVGEDAPKELLWTSADVEGPGRVKCKLAAAEKPYFHDVALLAIRHAAPKSDSNCAATAPAELDRLSGPWHEVTPPSPKSPTVVEIVDLASKIDAEGRLAWAVPEGRWTLLRFGYAAMEGHEFDVDVLDPEAVAGHFQRMGKTLLDDAGPLAVKTLTHFYSVSWEGAIPTWTGKLETYFKQYRGYPMRDYLPVLAGITVDDAEVSARFFHDYHQTLGDCFRDNFYGTLQELCHRQHLQWHSESGGPWDRKLATFKQADQLAFLARNDMPQGEFWHALGDRHAMNRQPAAAAHVYGKPLAATEAFTHMQRHWSAWPAVLKPDADQAFCDGVNHFIWHTFTASPPEFGTPGIEYFAGTHLNPNVTWWNQAGPLLTYLARCQFMLRQGRFVADVCCYTGEATYRHWGRWKQWGSEPTLKLGPGWTYDLVNTEVVLERMSVDQGDVVLPDGMRYRLLAVDLNDTVVPPAVLAKFIELAKAGATVVLGSGRPDRAPGLEDYPNADAEVRRLADELWGGKAPRTAHRRVGRGEIIVGTTMDDVLKRKDILPDVVGPWAWTHRRDGETDIYFLAGSGKAECVFRVAGKTPELWDAVTGTLVDAADWRTTDDGRTAVAIALPENGSCFVVFRKPGSAPDAPPANPPSGASIASKTLAGPWQVQFQPDRGAPASVVFDTLAPWNEHDEPGIRYFSGTAVYRTTFELSADQVAAPICLELGRVRNIAEVRLNGKPLGIVWTAPWAVDPAGAAKAGMNELEIAVTNLWINRLIGDAGLPPEHRVTKTNVPLNRKPNDRPHLGFAPTDPLEPSGLLGPVQLRFGQ